MKGGISELDKDIVIAELFEAISHLSRINILKLLEKKPYAFSELKQALRISSSGNLNHHLKKLKPLIDTDHHGDYILTNAGREALYLVKTTESMNQPERYTTFIIIISTLIFYSLYTTASLILGRFELNTLLFGVLLVVLFPLIFSYVNKCIINQGKT